MCANSSVKICSQLHYFIFAFLFGDPSGANDFFFSPLPPPLTPTNPQSLAMSLSGLTSPWKHRITLAEGVRRLGDLACAYKVGTATGTSFLSENNEEAPSRNLTSREASPSLSEVDSLSKVTFFFSHFYLR